MCDLMCDEIDDDDKNIKKYYYYNMDAMWGFVCMCIQGNICSDAIIINWIIISCYNSLIGYSELRTEIV